MIIIPNHSLANANPPSSYVGWVVTCDGNTTTSNVSLRQNVRYRLVAPVSLGSSFWIKKSTDPCKWILRPLGTPTSPPAPQGPATGNYRIRSYNNNQCLLTMSLADDSKGFVTQQLPGDKIQQQTVVSYSTYYPHSWTDLEKLSGR